MNNNISVPEGGPLDNRGDSSRSDFLFRFILKPKQIFTYFCDLASELCADKSSQRPRATKRLRLLSDLPSSLLRKSSLNFQLMRTEKFKGIALFLAILLLKSTILPYFRHFWVQNAIFYENSGKIRTKTPFFQRICSSNE